MKSVNKFWWFSTFAAATTLTVFVAVFFLFWNELTPDERQFFLSLFKKYFIYLFGAIVFAGAGIALALDGLFNTFIIPVIKLYEEINIINTVNPSHRIRMDAAKEVARLFAVINEMADRQETILKEVDGRIAKARAESDLEKNILAVFMSELSEGVLICNEQGRVLFYNRQARHHFESTESLPTGEPEEAGGRFVGLGRSVFDIIDKYLITSALDEISGKLEDAESDPVSHFILADRKGHLINVEAAPILNPQHVFAGFILVFRDISSQMVLENHLAQLFQRLSGQTRRSVASIRTAIETLKAYPDMAAEREGVLQEIIHTEALTLSRVVEDVCGDFMKSSQSRWPLLAMPLVSLFTGLKQKAIECARIQIGIPDQLDQMWIRAERYTLSLAVLSLLCQIREYTGVYLFFASAMVKENFIHVDLSWIGPPITTDMLKRWEEMPLCVGTESLPLTLRAVIGHHDGELCALRDAQNNTAAVRLILPVGKRQKALPKRQVAILPEARPEFFDFDLFHQAGQTPELDRTPLQALTFTVFDTETTGLDPNGGDKIISIGAVRLVNGRIIRGEPFDQLIDPRRALPPESIKIHGIEPEMLEGKPGIETVLPLFHKYCEGTVLVAHNAAFDLKMLQLSEKETGVSFTNPVLDTLLLSAVVHPAQQSHNLEAIASRLGVDIVSRHTALGDAVMTGEIFLKLMPLLDQMGIQTLEQAREASQKTYYARLRY